MKRLLIAMIAIVFSTGAVFADEVSDELTIARSRYWKARYGSSINHGIMGIDMVYKKMLNKVLTFIPEIGGYYVAKTNYTYSFASIDGILENFFLLEKVLSNQTAVITVKFDNSIDEVERMYYLSGSFEDLKNTGKYQKLTNTIKRKKTPYLWKKDTAYFIYVFEKDDDEILSGLVVSVKFRYLEKISRKNREKLRNLYFEEMFAKLKINTIKYYLK